MAEVVRRYTDAYQSGRGYNILTYLAQHLSPDILRPVGGDYTNYKSLGFGIISNAVSVHTDFCSCSGYPVAVASRHEVVEARLQGGLEVHSALCVSMKRGARRRLKGME